MKSHRKCKLLSKRQNSITVSFSKLPTYLSLKTRRIGKYKERACVYLSNKRKKRSRNKRKHLIRTFSSFKKGVSFTNRYY
jgi:hypothetical protein